VKTVRSTCLLQDNALEIRVSDQIEQLEILIGNENEGRVFFEKTFVTQGMRTLIEEGLARLAGKSSQAVFHLKQAMGGGKTHLLVGFGFLARHKALRSTYCPEIAHAQGFETAKVAIFNGRNSPQHFFWGEIADQLGKAERFKRFWAEGPKAPDEKAWLELFEGGEPILILIDELPPYFHDLATQSVGQGTVADIATRALSSMLTAASKKSNVCIVVSDLAASYTTGTQLIHKALSDARNELGRQERSITPVDLAGNEIYEILRKRLFKQLPDRAVIEDIAAAYGKLLTEATRAKFISREAESIADEIVNTYPFHPRLKNLIALFKENEKFKQTRGLMELISRLLKSIWERKEDDVFLISPQHFDLAIPDVREKLTEYSEMRDVIAKDLWDANFSAHAQIVSLNAGNDAAIQVGTLLLTASLSTAIHAVKGLTKEELLECLVSPLRGLESFSTALEALESQSWYMHQTPEGKFYFDRQENLTKYLQSLAENAPENRIDELIRERLKEMFKPLRKTVYEEVLPLPRLDEISDKVRKGRVLLVVTPDSKLPPEEVRKFFDSFMQKNHLCVLTGEKTQMGSVEKAARQLFAVMKADTRIPKGHPQRDELEKKRQGYEQDFTSTVLNLFDKLLFPVQLSGKAAQLRAKPLEITRDQSKSFNGEDQIEKTLTKDPLKLYLDLEANFEAIRSKSEDLLWPENSEEVRWIDALERFSEQSGMPWLPPKGIEQIKNLACKRGLWEEIGNGYVTKKPQRKKTSVQWSEESSRDDEGFVRLRINAQNAGPAPRIHYAEDGPVSQSSPILKEELLKTKAVRVHFLVVDPSKQYESGDPQTWEGKPVIRNQLHENGGKRKIELMAAPNGTLKYTLDGSEPRNGTLYSSPIEIDDEEISLLVFAEAQGVEAKQEFKFPARGKKGPRIDDSKPASFVAKNSKQLDSRSKTFQGLKDAKEIGVTFEKVTLNVGNGTKIASVLFGDLTLTAEYIEKTLNHLLESFDMHAPVTMKFSKASFPSGYDFKRFCESMGLEIQMEEVVQ
jgi:Protein of unknown function (DUF499)/Fn3 associated